MGTQEQQRKPQLGHCRRDVFIGGRLYSMGERTNGASVPSNPGGTAQTCEVYLRINGDSIDFQCSPLGQSAP
ncbi:hypothetical protein, partial [Verminephrobacter aporrectodeae]|uniref:hypothetical protein n=1 Tax=Verminephrobacter aporrectodeae TaxID=1110389 RepID=UPI00023776A8